MIDARQIITDIVHAAGYEVYDLEMPRAGNGEDGRSALRVFLCQLDGSAKDIGHQACATVSRQINDLPNLDEVLPGDVLIEVSSPGITRQLRTPLHFQGAVGEFVKVVVRGEGGERAKAVRGNIQSFADGVVMLQPEGEKGKPAGDVLQLPLTQIREAKVEYKF